MGVFSQLNRYFKGLSSYLYIHVNINRWTDRYRDTGEDPQNITTKIKQTNECIGTLCTKDFCLQTYNACVYVYTHRFSRKHFRMIYKKSLKPRRNMMCLSIA